MQYHQKSRTPALKSTATLINSGNTVIAGWNIYNQDSTVAYLCLYDTAAASAVTVSSTTPDLQLVLPGSGALDSWVRVASNDQLGLVSFKNGLVIAATTTVAVSANVAPTTGLLVNLVY